MKKERDGSGRKHTVPVSAWQDTGQYRDIMELPHHVSDRHPQMPMQDRAAQFAPFAALTGHGDVIREIENNHVGDHMERVEYEEDD